MSATDGALEQPCPSCGRPVHTEGFEPFNKVSCPGCGFQLRVERVFENYKIVEPLGTGGMGSVFKARDTRLNRFVALKLLRKEFAGDESFTAKLQEEARITASIKHPHVVEVFSVGSDHGQFYVVMELVDGGSLDDRMEDEKRIPELRTLEVGLQVAKGLQAALQAGLIHRDIKPGNILFAEGETARIVDFGLALLAEQRAESAGGEIWGTPYYVAPERLTSEPEDFRSDLYSLGATLFHAVAGRPAFEEETQSAAELKKLKANPIALREVAPDVSEATAAIIDRMLRPEPADRYPSYKALIDDLEGARAAFLAREQERRGRWSWPRRLAVSLGVIVLLGLAGYGLGFGLRHLPRSRASQAPAPAERARAALDLARQVEVARRELQAGRYAAAEARFREIATSAPNVQPMAELSAALQLWERGQFSQAATIFQRFRDLRPPPPFAWMNAVKALAQTRLDDYQLYAQWEQERPAARQDPEAALAKIRAVVRQIKSKGALSFQLADEEAKMAAQVAALTEKRSAEEKQLAAAERPRWEAALAAAGKANAAYQFDKAVALLEKVPLKAASLLGERATELQRARWLAEWKKQLINDINRTGYGGAVTDIHGVRYDGPVRRATAEKMELNTRYGTVMTVWLNLSPQMLLTMARAFAQTAGADAAERAWLSAIFARQTAQNEAARDLAEKAAASKPDFRDLLPRFFPETKK